VEVQEIVETPAWVRRFLSHAPPTLRKPSKHQLHAPPRLSAPLRTAEGSLLAIYSLTKSVFKGMAGKYCSHTGRDIMIPTTDGPVGVQHAKRHGLVMLTPSAASQSLKLKKALVFCTAPPMFSGRCGGYNLNRRHLSYSQVVLLTCATKPRENAGIGAGLELFHR
jgi:hypothetical protein